jgi:hypothetical protein
LASYYAALSDRAEQEIQASLRRQISECPNPTSKDVIERAERDRTTPYVPGCRGRRTITLGPALPIPPQPWIETGQEAPPKAEAIPSGVHPVVEAPPENFFARLLKWLKDFPI